MGAAREVVTCLTPEQRDRLWAEGQYELQVALEFDDGRDALLAEAQRVEDFVAFYDAIGWERVDDRDRYELALPEVQFRRIAERFREVATSLLGDDVGIRRECIDEDLELLQLSRVMLGEVG